MTHQARATPQVLAAGLDLDADGTCPMCGGAGGWPGVSGHVECQPCLGSGLEVETDQPNPESHPVLLTAERIVAMHAQMTEVEKQALASWEQALGDGELATSDWPGWQAVYQRLGH